MKQTIFSFVVLVVLGVRVRGVLPVLCFWVVLGVLGVLGVLFCSLCCSLFLFFSISNGER